LKVASLAILVLAARKAQNLGQAPRVILALVILRLVAPVGRLILVQAVPAISVQEAPTSVRVVLAVQLDLVILVREAPVVLGLVRAAPVTQGLVLGARVISDRVAPVVPAAQGLVRAVPVTSAPVAPALVRAVLVTLALAAPALAPVVREISDLVGLVSDREVLVTLVLVVLASVPAGREILVQQAPVVLASVPAGREILVQ